MAMQEQMEGHIFAGFPGSLNPASGRKEGRRDVLIPEGSSDRPQSAANPVLRVFIIIKHSISWRLYLSHSCGATAENEPQATAVV
jgi:hypothetical protein